MLQLSMKLLLSILLLSLPLFGQASLRKVDLQWEDLLNPVGTKYDVYRASGQCSTTSTFTKITLTSLSTKTYQDSVNPGWYCYQATATFNSIESDASNQAEVKVKPFGPTKLIIIF